jgi:hypothetical protein
VRCHEIIDDIKLMISNKTPLLHPSLEGALSDTERADLSLLDNAYYHVALIQIYQRIYHLPATHFDVQLRVKNFLDYLSMVDLQHESCPGSALLQPIYVASCEASTADDRERITM